MSFAIKKSKQTKIKNKLENVKSMETTQTWGYCIKYNFNPLQTIIKTYDPKELDINIVLSGLNSQCIVMWKKPYEEYFKVAHAACSYNSSSKPNPNISKYKRLSRSLTLQWSYSCKKVMEDVFVEIELIQILSSHLA